MFPIRKRIFHLHLGGKVIRTTADHPLYIEGKSWVNAGDMPGAKVEGEQEVMPNLGESTMPNFPFVGFVAGGALPSSGEKGCSLETCVWGKTGLGGIASGVGGCKC